MNASDSADILAIFNMSSVLTSTMESSVEEIGTAIWPPSSKKTKGESTGPCVVCEAEKAGYHFGVNACAACSAFFRRTVSENRKYVCRKTGTEHLNCPIDKRQRCFCRACRLKKCLATGMDPRSVQPHRDSIGSKSKGLPYSNQPSDDNIKDTIYPSSDQIYINTKSDTSLIIPNCMISNKIIIPKTELTDVDSLIETDVPSIDSHSVSSDSSCSSPYDPRQNLIEITVIEYRKLLERRRLFYCSSSVRDIVGGALPVARPAKFLDRVRQHHTRIEVVLFVEFLNSIHPFSQLSVDDKVILMKHLSISWSILEKYYCTMKGGGLESNRIIHSDGTYTDLEDPAAIEFDSKPIAGENLDKETLNKLFITPLRDALREISGPMQYFQMTDVEFCALTAILLFDAAANGLSEQSKIIIKDARDKVFREWRAYYRNHSMNEGCDRMGNALLLLPAVQTTVEKTAESIRLIRLFDLFDYDPIVDDLLST